MNLLLNLSQGQEIIEVGARFSETLNTHFQDEPAIPFAAIVSANDRQFIKNNTLLELT